MQGVAYVLVVGRALWAVFYRTIFREPWTEGGERQLAAELASREIIAKLPHAGGCPGQHLELILRSARRPHVLPVAVERGSPAATCVACLHIRRQFTCSGWYAEGT